MKIVDSISFYNELDILEIRLATMYDHVDRFVIVESDKTFTGLYKGYNLEKNWDRYKQWADKIHYVKIVGLTLPDPWKNEFWQNSQTHQGWYDLTDEDVVIVGDCDEIVRPEAIEFLKKTDYDFYGFMTPMSYFRFNYVDCFDNNGIWPRAFRGYRDFENTWNMRFMNEIPGGKNVNLQHAGWHLSWQGDEQAALTKLKSFSHSELNIPKITDNLNIDRMIAEKKDHIHQADGWRVVKLDEYFPKAILENKEKYAKYILPDSDKTVRDFYPAEICSIDNYTKNNRAGSTLNGLL